MTSTLAMTKLKNQLVAINPGLKVELRNIRVNGQLRGCSGFVTNPATGAVAYVGTETDTGRAHYRTARDTRDFAGGSNQYATFLALPQAVVDLISA
jgi:hypothetical protein